MLGESDSRCLARRSKGGTTPQGQPPLGQSGKMDDDADDDDDDADDDDDEFGRDDDDDDADERC